MQSVFSPHGKTQMSDIQSGLRCRDSQDITIVNHRAKQFAILYLRLRNIAELPSRQLFLLFCYHRHILWTSLQRLVRLWMLTHIVHANRLYRCKGRFLHLYLVDDTLLTIVYNPVREIM